MDAPDNWKTVIRHPIKKFNITKENTDYPAAARQMTAEVKAACEGAETALKQDLTNALCTLPSHYVFDGSYKEHFHAVKYANYPGFEKIGSHTIRMETDDLTDILRAITFVL